MKVMIDNCEILINGKNNNCQFGSLLLQADVAHFDLFHLLVLDVALVHVFVIVRFLPILPLEVLTVLLVFNNLLQIEKITELSPIIERRLRFLTNRYLFYLILFVFDFGIKLLLFLLFLLLIWRLRFFLTLRVYRVVVRVVIVTHDQFQFPLKRRVHSIFIEQIDLLSDLLKIIELFLVV